MIKAILKLSLPETFLVFVRILNIIISVFVGLILSQKVWIRICDVWWYSALIECLSRMFGIDWSGFMPVLHGFNH